MWGRAPSPVHAEQSSAAHSLASDQTQGKGMASAMPPSRKIRFRPRREPGGSPARLRVVEQRSPATTTECDEMNVTSLLISLQSQGMGTRLLPIASFRCDRRTLPEAQNPPALCHGRASNSPALSQRTREGQGTHFLFMGKAWASPQRQRQQQQLSNK